MEVNGRIIMLSCVLVLACCFSYVSAQQVCVDKHYECEDIRAEKNVHFEDTAFTSVVFDLNQTALDSVCSIYKRGDDCELELLALHECYIFNLYFFDHVGYAGYNDSWYFLCNHGKQDYLANVDCLTSVDVYNVDTVCSAAFNESFEALLTMPIDPYYQGQYLCQYIDDYLDCVESSTTHLCGHTAGLWLRVLYTKNLEVLYITIGCQLDTSGYLHFTTTTTTISAPTGQGSIPSTATTTTTTTTTTVAPPQAAAVTGSHIHDGIIAGCVTIAVLLIIAVFATIIITYACTKMKKNNVPARQSNYTLDAPNTPTHDRHPLHFNHLYQNQPEGAEAAMPTYADPVKCKPEEFNDEFSHVRPSQPPMFSNYQPQVHAHANRIVSPPPPYSVQADTLPDIK